MSISYLTHQNVQIMFADYRECPQTDQQLTLLEEVAKTMEFESGVRLLVDYNGVTAGVEYMTRLKELGNTVFKQHMKCSAVLGITGLKKILFNGYNRATGANNVKAFIDREEALDWLVNFWSFIATKTVK